MNNDNNVVFREIQRIKQKWVFAGISFLLLLDIIIFGIGIYRQLFLGKQWGSKPLSDAGLITAAVLAVGVPLLLLILFLNTRLITEVRNDGLYVKYFPFHVRYHKISLDNVKDVQAVTYHPIKEYGGWGIRYGKNGKAYNVSGKEGVLVNYANGKTLMIGSQKKVELANAVKSLLK